MFNKIIDHLKTLPYVEYIDIALGWSDLQIEVIIENVNSLTQIMDEIANKFPNTIKKQNIMIATDYHKERWLPELF